jgi:hypothetical protein
MSGFEHWELTLASRRATNLATHLPALATHLLAYYLRLWMLEGGGGDVVFIYFVSLWEGRVERMTCLESYLTWSSLGSCSSILLRRIWRSSVGGRATCKMGSNIIRNTFQWPRAGKQKFWVFRIRIWLWIRIRSLTSKKLWKLLISTVVWLPNSLLSLKTDFNVLMVSKNRKNVDIILGTLKATKEKRKVRIRNRNRIRIKTLRIRNTATYFSIIICC